MSTLITNTVQGVQNIKYDASTTAMTIDSSGRVLTPTRPHCFVVFDETATGGYQSVASGNVLPFASAKINVGGGTYDTSNYRYTVPITGMYQVTFNLLLDGVTTLSLYLRVDGSVVHYWYIADARHMTWTYLHEVNSGSYFDIGHDTGGSRNINKAGTAATTYTSVSYTLIG